MANNVSGSPVVMAAVVLGISIIGSSYLFTSSVDRATNRLHQAFGQLQAVNVQGGTAQAKAQPEPAKPDEVHEVALGDAPSKGPKSAKVTIVEFTDFQCPFCSRVGPTLAQVQKEYPNDVRIVFKHLPLSFHEQALPAHQAAEAARMQGKFWQMHDKIFAAQRDLAPATFERYAQEIGLDVARYKQDLNSPAVLKRVKSDGSQAAKLGVTGTPVFFINGRKLTGNHPFTSFKKVIDEELKKGLKKG